MYLRCTLTGLERGYQIKIPSKQLNNRSRFLTSTILSDCGFSIPLNPWFITGFTDAEGCFTIKIQRNEELKTKWRVRPVFSITLHIKDLSLLEAIKNTLGVGNISKSNKVAIFSVDSIKDTSVLLNHFDRYPLITQKLSDYLIFKQCFEIINKGEHLTESGLLEIIGLKSALNLGLPDYLKKAFPNIQGKDRPEYFYKGIPDPYWVSGFTSGEGSFHIVIRNSKKSVFARFSIHLHIRDLDVLKGIASFLNLDPKFKDFTELSTEEGADVKMVKRLGLLRTKKITILKKSVNWQISKITDLIEIIIPFFNKYPILGMKSSDFEDFTKVCNLLTSQKHLNLSRRRSLDAEVLNQIVQIKSGMNLNRK
jgi:hypothetical protein